MPNIALKNSSIPSNVRLFGVYIYYRLGMSTLLAILFLSGLGNNFLGTNSPTLFIYTSYAHISICALSLALFLFGTIKAQANHVIFLVITDFIALVLLIYTNDSSAGSLGYLLLIPMAISSTFLRGLTSVALAAFTSLLLLSFNGLNYLNGINDPQTIVISGMNGALLFITAISFRLLSKKIQSSEEAIQLQLKKNDYLHNLGQRIIETMNTGIIVLDDQVNILLINQAAKELLSKEKKFSQLSDVTSLYRTLIEWHMHKRIPQTLNINLGINYEIKVSFTELSDNKIKSLMLFIEDEKNIHQQAQQLKLASLGRLTSSIAHEIRNPLGAISHASQLLNESSEIPQAEHELLHMINENTQRINQTINNILQFSRRKKSDAEVIDLNTWIEKFYKNYLLHTKANIILHIPTETILCYIDPNHLLQIVNNLVDNGLRHSKKSDDYNIITIEAGYKTSNQQVFINIIDEGEGISDDYIDAAFEPFYSTKTTGSGLGLYLCKELCQANKAGISYFKKEAAQKSCFQLTLATTH